jgi:4-amino-4-deoxy-L-arabinose transferase-like glycosyltransferase
MTLILAGLIALVGGLGTFVVLAWLAWPWVKRHPRWSAALVVLLLLFMTTAALVVRGDRGRRATIHNDADVPYLIFMTQGSEKPIFLGEFAPRSWKRLRIDPSKGPVLIRFDPESKEHPSGSVGFSLDGPAFLPPAARVQVGGNGRFNVRVLPAILDF